MGCVNSKTNVKPRVTATKSDRAARQEQGDDKGKIVMGKYRMNMGKEDLMGEGTSSICRKGVNLQTGEEVAIKVYKGLKGNPKADEVKLQKFRRQIKVLKELQEPFVPPSDPTLNHPALASCKPSRLFMKLIDYSQDERGEPIADPNDGVMYVVTELAQYSLKDYFALRKEQNKPLAPDAVKFIARAIVLVLAGLHAKGLVHIDMKPENLMMFNGRLKLIDVDGCVKAGSKVSIQDSSISFSPCYCAPEWARFLIEESESKITIRPALDVWSVGITICELVTLDAILKKHYANFLRNGHSHREAGFLFMDWLSSIKKAPLPRAVEEYDRQFVDLLHNFLLVCDQSKRKSCAQCLDHPFLKDVKVDDSEPKAGAKATLDDSEEVMRTLKERIEDQTGAPLYKGTLWTLNNHGDPKEPKDWTKRDMWVARNGSLCYFSTKDNKRLVLIEGARLSGANIKKYESQARGFAFELVIHMEDHAEEELGHFLFSCESQPEYEAWTTTLNNAVHHGVMQTFRLGGEMEKDLAKFRIQVKNRRMRVAQDEKDKFEPMFKAKLWKVKAEGNKMNDEDWFEREMWIAKNGSLVYWSKKEERELVYYTADDIAKATINLLRNEESAKPWTFQVQLPAAGDVEFAPAEFAAESEVMRQKWIEEFRHVQQHHYNA